MPNGPTRKNPAWRSSSVPNTLGESKRGTHSQSIAPSGATNAPVWQLEMKAYSAIGGKGGRGAEPRGRGAPPAPPPGLAPPAGPARLAPGARRAPPRRRGGGGGPP